MIKIVIDSTAGMDKQTAEKLGITITPLKLLFSDGEYFEGYPDSYPFFYEKIEKGGEFPKTSLPSPETFSDTFKDLTKGKNQVICITISSALSGTYQSAKSAAKNFKDNVFVIDSQNCCQNIQVLAEEAHEMAEGGKSAQEIVEHLNTIKGNLEMKFVPKSLEYLKKGGRIGLLTASLGSILKIKPIISFKQGMLVSKKKVIGMGKAIIELVKGIHTNAKKIYVCKIGNSELFDKLLIKVKETFSNAIIKVGEISPVMGAHVGPGTLGIAAI